MRTDETSISAIIAENKRRKSLLNEEYTPVSGEKGTYGERVKFIWRYKGEKIRWFIPVMMLKEDCVALVKKHNIDGLIDIIRQQNGVSVEGKTIVKNLIRLRCKYDFEFWAACFAIIKDKETSEMMKFVLRRPQRKLLRAILDQFYDNIPIRIILCKARQWGGSTLVQIFMEWLQIFHFKNWNSCIVAEKESQADNIMDMFSTVAKNHSPLVKKITMRNFRGSSKTKYINETGAIIYVGSMKEPDKLRSADIKLAHLSEIGIWKETKGKKPEDVIQTVVGSVPLLAGTMIVKESTAKGIGNYFHKSWQAAVKGEGDTKEIPVFVAWYEIDMYQMQVPNKEEFIELFTEYDKFLWDKGATLEGINWYHHKLAECHGDTWVMQSEFPTTPDEAFQSHARRVFSPVYTKRAAKHVKPPLMVGDLHAFMKTGQGALQDIEFVEQDNGYLKVWIKPEPYYNDNGELCIVKNRYCGFLDPARGHSNSADFGVLTIIDRLPLLKGQAVELAAQWRGRLDQDIVAWRSAAICKWYDNALFAVEVNALKRKTDQSATVLDEISDWYDNLYCRSSVEDIQAKLPRKYGFFTNDSSKNMILSRLNEALRETTFIERDEQAIIEYDAFEEKDDGSTGAIEGMHDDIVISRAGAIWLACSYMDAPQIIVASDKNRTTQRKKYNEATF
ncbi:MAG: hypothetical protein LBG17_03200 [Bacteroidales bacterium]|jgi:hypothetical protein|nr:hypothetical protein [Bacteroidales bacterium]